MPGRSQSTRPPSSLRKVKPKPKKRKVQRTLNALAIAEKEIPGRINIRRARLGESEPQIPNRKRRRERDDEDEGTVKGTSRRVVRNQRVRKKINEQEAAEGGSDGIGNEWTVGQVDEDEDSELDSDEAMGESDEERFDGYAFGGSSSGVAGMRSGGMNRGQPVKEEGLGNVDLDERSEEGEMDGEDDGLGGEGVELATILDDDDNDEDEKEEPSSDKRKTYENRELSGSEKPSDATDEESDHEKEDSVLSISDSEDDTTNPSKLASLQALVSSMNNPDGGSTRNHAPDAQELMTPSEFGLNSKRKLSVADLILSVKDPQLKKSLKLLAEDNSKSRSKPGRIPKKLDVPLPKRQQDRLDRAAAYEKSKETLNRWVDTVKRNRRAEHLSFPLQESNATAPPGERRMLPNTQSKPLTDLESTIQTILQESGLAPQNGKSEEGQIRAFEELETNKMPIEEVLARRADLRRKRELLFREEIRAKRIKKIKSKTYRKIHRKERERDALRLKDAMAANGDDDSESEKERNDRRRAEERMGARHRESRWAKGIKDSARTKWDDDAREGVNEMARRGEELRRRIEGNYVRDTEGSVLSSEEDEDGDEHIGGDEDKDHQRLQAQLDNLQGDEVPENGTEGSRLSNMEFMKRAEATRKARNNADAESLRRDLAGEEIPSEKEEAEGPGRKSYGPQRKQPERPHSLQAIDKSEFEEREGSADEDRTVSQEAEVDMDRVIIDAGHGNLAKQVTNEHIAAPAPVIEGPWNALSGKVSRAPAGQTQQDAVVKATAKEKEAAPRPALNSAQPAEKVKEISRLTASEELADDAGSDHDEDTEEQPIVFRNAELAKRAFAGDDVVDKFLEEKEELIQEQKPQEIDNTLPGWGTWTGPGLSKKAQKRNAKKKFVTKVPGIAPENRKDAKLKDVIISEKRVKKNAKYLAGQLPHPFETRAQYERSLRLPVGPEWTTKETYQAMTKPRILMKQGVIAPMAKPMV